MRFAAESALRGLRALSAVGKRLPEPLRAPLRRLWRRILASERWDPATRYRLRIDAEQAVYRDRVEVHDLPGIFHYWSNRYLRPKLESFGFSSPDAFFVEYSIDTLRARGPLAGRLLSIGCGNGEAEVGLARALRDAGLRDFVIECVDINPSMLERGAQLAERENLATHLQFRQADFNHLRLEKTYDVVLANQSLHHVVALEHLFAEIAGALGPHGRFLVSDMIGRNGHMRWPEAEVIVRRLWSELPDEKKYNHQLHRTERDFENTDASTSGFEGIRAQDVLPCLLRVFGIELFIGFANVVDIFVDRSFGPNFDADSPEDRAFIDKVHAIDEAAILGGQLTPTHALIAARSTAYEGDTASWAGLTPQKAVRA